MVQLGGYYLTAARTLISLTNLRPRRFLLYHCFVVDQARRGSKLPDLPTAKAPLSFSSVALQPLRAYGTLGQ